MSPFENADYTEEVSITSLGGLDFTNMANNEIIRKTSDTTAEGSGTTIQDEVAGEFYIKKIFNFINVPPFNILLGGILNSYNILTSSYKTQIAPKSSSIGSSQGLFLTSTVLDGNIKVGINKSDPEEELEIDGNIQIDSGDQARLKFQKSGGSPHALGEIDGEQDGTNGGTLEFYTKVDGGGVTEKLRINNKGAIGVGGANFGNDGQFLMSKGNAAVPVWSNTVRNIVKFKGTSNTLSGTAGAIHDIIFPNGWTASNTSNTFCEEYGTGGSSSATKDGSIKILENGTYIITTKFVLSCYPALAFQVSGRVTKIPAAGGSTVYIGQIQLSAWDQPLGTADTYVISSRSAMDVELEDLVNGDRIILQMFAQGADITAGTNTQIMIEKL
jgi:hypothetical protein